jgi:hypothetical protein
MLVIFTEYDFHRDLKHYSLVEIAEMIKRGDKRLDAKFLLGENVILIRKTMFVIAKTRVLSLTGYVGVLLKIEEDLKVMMGLMIHTEL